MDKALKQRLVGAVVLIALAVIVLPMLFGGRPAVDGAGARSIELPAAPPDLDFETRRFPVGEQSAATGAGEDVRDGRRDRTSQDFPKPATQNLPEPSGPVSERALEPLPGAGTEDLPGTEQQAPSAAPETRDDEGMEALVQDLMASNDSTTELRYVVQVASFGSSANALRLAGQLAEDGYAVLQDQVSSDTGRLNRVRVGPFASESEAQQAAADLRDRFEGVNPRVVDMQPDEETPALASEDPLLRWVVQVGSFSSQDNARQLVSRLRAMGLSAYDETISNAAATIHRVRVGPFLDRADALEAERAVAEGTGINGVVMSSD